MKPGWKTVKLGEVCDFERGLTYSKSDEAEAPGITVLRANNVDLASGRLNLDDLRYISARVVVDEKKYLSANSIIVCTASGSRDHLGKTAHISNPPRMTFGGFMGLLRPSREIDSLFLFYLTRSDLYRSFISSLSSGTNINNLKGSDLLSWEIPLPPLAEQKRIVALLDEAFAGIDKAKANAEVMRANAKELKASLLSRHLMPDEAATKAGWKIVKLDELIEVQNGYAFSSKDYSDSGHFLMRIGNVQNGRITTSDPKYVQLPPDRSLNRFTLVRGDILVSLTGNVGRVGVISDVHLPAALNQRVARITPRSHAPISREFLLHFLGSDSFREQLSDAGRGSAQQNVSTKDLIALEIPLPPLAEQKRIVALLDDAFAGIDHLDLNISNAIAGYFDLKASLLSQAFAGELTA